MYTELSFQNPRESAFVRGYCFALLLAYGFNVPSKSNFDVFTSSNGPSS
jgi:hypothetical protein